MHVLYLDTETYSATDLRKTGVYPYAQDPDFQILMVAYGWDDGPIQIEEGPGNDKLLAAIQDPDVLKVAHNAQFDRICYSAALGMREGDYLDPAEWFDSATLTAAYGFGRKLETAALAMGGPEQKDQAGGALINYFSIPNPVTGGRRLPESAPDKWELFKKYCMQDVETMRHMVRRLGGPKLRGNLAEEYRIDQIINDRGMKIDFPMAVAGKHATEAIKGEAESQLIELTGVAKPKGIKLHQWVQDQDVDIPNMQEATITEALESWELSRDVRTALQLRQLIGPAAASKYAAAVESAGTDHRIRGSFQFHGAHTGRWSGKGVQPQNLPKAKIEPLEKAEAAITSLKDTGESDIDTLGALVRNLFTGPLTVVDYSAIEARVLAWEAGEKWALGAFSRGEDIYVAQAARMGSGVSRSDGKVATLALGYGGSVGALRHMGYGKDKSDEEIKELVDMYRAANQSIVMFWRNLERAFIEGGKVGPVRVTVLGNHRYIWLPSGRCIGYHDVQFGDEISYLKPELIKNKDPEKRRTRTYGGKLTENVTQAIARDLLAAALVRLESEGYRVVGHVHDEVIVEGDHTVEDVSRVMCEAPRWAVGLPVNGAGYTCSRYVKD